MTVSTYTRPTHRQPSRWFLPVAGIAFGIAGLAMSVVVIVTDDVGTIVPRTVVAQTPVTSDPSSVVPGAPAAAASLTDDAETCNFPRIGMIDRC